MDKLVCDSYGVFTIRLSDYHRIDLSVLLSVIFDAEKNILGMHLERYEFDFNEDLTQFYFTSVGPMGAIRKIVLYDIAYQYVGVKIVNLSFGDRSDASHEIDYSVISNNNDRGKVLATIAMTVNYFVEYHGNCRILATGQSPAKTRLYQMALNANRKEIEMFFTVFGKYKGSWFPFEHGCNYDAFFIVPKDLVNLI